VCVDAAAVAAITVAAGGTLHFSLGVLAMFAFAGLALPLRLRANELKQRKAWAVQQRAELLTLRVNALVDPSAAELAAFAGALGVSDSQTFRSSKMLIEATVPASTVYLTRLLASGAVGEVWAAEYQGATVAVKRLLRRHLTDAGRIAAFYREIMLMSRLRHPFVVAFIGWVNEPPLLQLLLQYAARGDLAACLRPPAGSPGAQEVLTWRDPLLRLATEVAMAMQYLSGERKLAVRDLKVSWRPYTTTVQCRVGCSSWQRG
jgi:hypothetical protein